MVTLDWGDGRTYSCLENALGAMPASLSDDYDLPGYKNSGDSLLYTISTAIAINVTATNGHTVTIRGTEGSIDDLGSQIHINADTIHTSCLSAYGFAQAGLYIDNFELSSDFSSGSNSMGIYCNNKPFNAMFSNLYIHDLGYGIYRPTSLIMKNIITENIANYGVNPYGTCEISDSIITGNVGGIQLEGHYSSIDNCTIYGGNIGINNNFVVKLLDNVIVGANYALNTLIAGWAFQCKNNIFYSINNPTLITSGKTFTQWEEVTWKAGILADDQNRILDPKFKGTGNIKEQFEWDSGSPLDPANQSFVNNPLWNTNKDKGAIGAYTNANDPVWADASDVRSGVDRGDGTDGTLDLPSVSDVKKDVVFDNTTKTGTLESTDPGESNVKKDTTYKIESSDKTGTLESTDPGVENVEKDVTYKIESVDKTGTRNDTDPGVANVLKDITYYINSILKTGSYVPDFPERTNTLTRDTVNNLDGLYTPCPEAGPNGITYGANNTEFTLAVPIDLPTQGIMTATDNGNETATFTISGTDTVSTTNIYKRNAQQSAWDDTAIATITGNDSATVALVAGEYEIKAIISSVGGSQVLGSTDPVPLHIQNPDKSIQYFEVKDVVGMPGTGFKRVALETRHQPINPQTPGS